VDGAGSNSGYNSGALDHFRDGADFFMLRIFRAHASLPARNKAAQIGVTTVTAGGRSADKDSCGRSRSN